MSEYTGYAPNDLNQYNTANIVFEKNPKIENFDTFYKNQMKLKNDLKLRSKNSKTLLKGSQKILKIGTYVYIQSFETAVKGLKLNNLNFLRNIGALKGVKTGA